MVSTYKKLALTLALSLVPLLLPLAASATCDASGCTLNNPLQVNDLCSLLMNILQMAMYLGVPVAIFFIVLSGARFVFAQGSETKLKDARQGLLYTIIGIAVFFGATLIAQVIVGTLKNFNVSVGTCSSVPAAQSSVFAPPTNTFGQ